VIPQLFARIGAIAAGFLCFIGIYYGLFTWALRAHMLAAMVTVLLWSGVVLPGFVVGFIAPTSRTTNSLILGSLIVVTAGIPSLLIVGVAGIMVMAPLAVIGVPLCCAGAMLGAYARARIPALPGAHATSPAVHTLTRTLKVIVGVLLVAVVAYVAHYLPMLLSACTRTSRVQTVSADQRFHAELEQFVCQDPKKSYVWVYAGKRGTKERALLEVRGTSQVSLSWSDDGELAVSYPSSAVINRFDGHGYGDLPPLSLRPEFLK
jgi:hypothetical protein